VIYQHPLAYLLGLEGLALLRAFSGECDRDFTLARFSEIQTRLVDDRIETPLTRNATEFLNSAIFEYQT
jgi:hypothetical protein